MRGCITGEGGGQRMQTGGGQPRDGAHSDMGHACIAGGTGIHRGVGGGVVVKVKGPSIPRAWRDTEVDINITGLEGGFRLPIVGIGGANATLIFPAINEGGASSIVAPECRPPINGICPRQAWQGED